MKGHIYERDIYMKRIHRDKYTYKGTHIRTHTERDTYGESDIYGVRHIYRRHIYGGIYK